MLMAYMVRSDKLEFKPGVGFPGDEGYGKEDEEAKFYYFDDFVDYLDDKYPKQFEWYYDFDENVYFLGIRNNNSLTEAEAKQFISRILLPFVDMNAEEIKELVKLSRVRDAEE